MKVIFLDIDGVLNTEVYICSAFQALNLAGIEEPRDTAAYKDDYGHIFDPLAVRALQIIIEKTGAKIVISSTWRGAGLSVMQEMWTARNLPGEVIDITPYSTSRHRGKEIQAWLQQNPLEGYLILDDDSDMLPWQ